MMGRLRVFASFLPGVRYGVAMKNCSIDWAPPFGSAQAGVVPAKHHSAQPATNHAPTPLQVGRHIPKFLNGSARHFVVVKASPIPNVTVLCCSWPVWRARRCNSRSQFVPRQGWHVGRGVKEGDEILPLGPQGQASKKAAKTPPFAPQAPLPKLFTVSRALNFSAAAEESN